MGHVGLPKLWNNHNDNNKLTKGKNKKKSIKNSKEINKTETLSGKYKSENAQHSSKRKVKSKLIRSYTFNFAQKPDLACEAPKNSNIGPNNIYNTYKNNFNNISSINTSVNLGFFRRTSIFTTSGDYYNNDPNPSYHGSQSDLLLGGGGGEESLVLKQPVKNTFEAFINKYDHKKDKIIRYFILLNSKMMLYFKNDCKSRFRGLYYLSDAFAKATYDKTQTIISNGTKHFYINLHIKGSVKWFVFFKDFFGSLFRKGLFVFIFLRLFCKKFVTFF